jgi:hypothetical protein
MAKNTQLTNAAVNAEADALAALCNSGYIDILDGTQAATADTAIGAQVVLVSLTFGATAFGAASAGVITANSIGAGTAGNSGTASWFRIYKSDHTTVVFDGTADTSSANLILPTTTITAGQSITATSFTHTVAKSTSGT